MNLGQLRTVLSTAAEQYRRDGRDEIADALSKIAANLLIGDDSQSVEALVKRIEKARLPSVARTSRKQRRKR
jgi:hypothetical protein